MHRTHLPLTVWFWAIYLCATDKRGISAVQRRGTDKAKIVVALSKTENGAALFTRMQVVKDVTSKTLQQVIGKTVATGAKIECDGYRFNRRKTGNQIFVRLARAVAASCAQLH